MKRYFAILAMAWLAMASAFGQSGATYNAATGVMIRPTNFAKANRMGFVNVVTEYGAKGDGVTFTDEPIQLAITENPGATIYIPAGIYRLHHTITNIPNNSKIIGAGSGRIYESDGFYVRSGTTLLGASISNVISYSSIYGVTQTNNYTTLEGFTVDGQHEVNVGVYMTGTHKVHDVNFTGCLVAGLVLWGKYDTNTGGPYYPKHNMVNSILIDDCSFVWNQSGDGLFVQYSGGLITPYHVRDSIFRANRYGINMEEGYQSKVEDFVVEQNFSEGIHIYKKGTGQTLNNVVFRDGWLEDNSLSLVGTNKNSVSIDSEYKTDEGAPRGIVWDNVYFQLGPTATNGTHFKIGSALLMDVKHSVYYGGNALVTYMPGAYVNGLFASDYIYPWPGFEFRALYDLRNYLGVEPLFISGGFDTTSHLGADAVPGYGGIISGYMIQDVGGGLKIRTRNNYVTSWTWIDISPTGVIFYGTPTNAAVINLPYIAGDHTAPTNGHSILAGSTALRIIASSDTGAARPISLEGSSVQLSPGETLGMGTNSPEGNIHIFQATGNPLITLETAGGGTPMHHYKNNLFDYYAGIDSDGSFVVLRGTAPYTRYLTITTNGDIGIGKSPVGLKMDIAGDTADFVHYLRGATSGYTGLSVPAVAGANIIVFPATMGNAGDTLITDGAGHYSHSPMTMTGTNGGIGTINGLPAANQAIVGGTGIGVISSAATHTISALAHNHAPGEIIQTNSLTILGRTAAGSGGAQELTAQGVRSIVLPGTGFVVATNSGDVVYAAFGSTAGTVAQGNDSRFHTILSLGTPNGLSLAGQVLSLAFGSDGTHPAAGNDARFSDSRTPTAHTQAGSTITSAVAEAVHATAADSATTAGTALTATSASSSALADYATSAGQLAHDLTAGSGLMSSGTFNGSSARTFAVSFAGSGSANTAARSDHTHGLSAIDGVIKSTQAWDTSGSPQGNFSTWEYEFDVAGAAVGDPAIASIAGQNGQPWEIAAHCTSAGKVTVKAHNVTGGTSYFTGPVHIVVFHF